MRFKVILIISLVFVSLTTAFFWFGKTPFDAHETNDQNHSPMQTELLEDSNPVESQEGANLQDEIETSEYPDDPIETEDILQKILAEILSMNNGPLELPVEGATGWAAVAMPLYMEADIESDIAADFDAGQVFVIIKEQGDWWRVESSAGESGWVEHLGCFINLPDVIPSIVYDITNAYSALTRSSGYEIPGVTGQKLYEARAYNPRFSRHEFIVPSLYSTGKLLFTAQRLALEAGDTIILHEAYRDHESQQRSVALLRELMDANKEVRNAINDGPWSLNWFIATSLSNHQRGVAFDVSLGKIQSFDIEQVGEASFVNITAYEEYAMPTAMHELSPMAIALIEPVSARSRDAWRDIPLADTMTPGAILLQRYFDKAGFTPLASEWWHFNDLDGVAISSDLGIVGCFLIGEILSVLPDALQSHLR